jgi:ABC-type nitrate/sulfonate/bicarbonate transport system permease component
MTEDVGGGGAVSAVERTHDGEAALLRASPLARRHIYAVLRWASQFSLLAAVLVAWEVISSLAIPRWDPSSALLFPAPSHVVRTMGRLMATGDLFIHIGSSLRRVCIGYLTAAFMAVPLGVAMGWWKAVEVLVDPLVNLLRPVPPLAWIPISILWFGIGDAQNGFIIWLCAFFPILLNTATGVKAIDPLHVRAALCLGATRTALFRRIILNGALPSIVTGLRIGLGIGWMGLVAAELVAAPSGLGYLISDARSLLATDVVVVGMVTIGLLGLLIDIAVRRVAKALIPWLDSPPAASGRERG